MPLETQPAQADGTSGESASTGTPKKSSSKSSIRSKSSKTSLKSVSGTQVFVKNETSPEVSIKLTRVCVRCV